MSLRKFDIQHDSLIYMYCKMIATIGLANVHLL